jgi:hypothetical protein
MNSFKRKALCTVVLGALGAALAAPFGLFATTSTARLSNGTTVEISVGSPTSYTTVNNCRNVSFMDGTSAEVDVTNLTSDWMEKMLGLPDGGKVTWEVDTNFGDAGQAALITAKNTRTLCNLRITLPGGTTPTITFMGYVQKFTGAVNVNTAIKSQVEFLVTGPVVIA